MEITEIFEEWDVYASQRPLIQRNVPYDRIINNARLKIIAISGVRRSGKSSMLMLLRQLLKKEAVKVKYVNIEDSRLKGMENLLDEVLKWFGDTGFLLLDEITSANGWEGWLARVHEQTKGKLKIVVTSSRTGIATPHKPLRGRMLQFKFYPLSFSEYLSFKGVRTENTVVGRGKKQKAMAEYMKYGGFPEIVLLSDQTDKVRYLASYFNDIVGLDVAEITAENIGVVDTFSRYVLQSPYFSASKCFNFIKGLGYKIGKEKILKLENSSQASYLFFFLPIFSRNIKDKSQYPRKAYCGDTGFFYSITGKENNGRVFENIVFLELKRRIKETEDICYWKDSAGFEIDFVIKSGNDAKELIQVAYDVESEKTRNREIGAIVRSAKEFGLKEGIIITSGLKGITTTDGIKIKMIPFDEWISG